MKPGFKPFAFKCNLYRYSAVLDVPDFFWAVPDRYCRLYEEMRVYLAGLYK
jgi:uncharacterized Rmd1/YagE family protein